jgi:hypothetical protein
MVTNAAFWIDREYDRDQASDGVSRYGHYLRSRLGWFRDTGCWEESGHAAESFAVVAWRIATSPVMAPGYARRHPAVLGTQVERSDWDGSLLASVEVITPWPTALTRSRDWRRGKWWREWPSEPVFGSDQMSYYEPSGEDLAKDPYLLASACLRFTLTSGDLPVPPAGESFSGDAPLARSDCARLTGTAQRAVEVLAAELNSVVVPVLGILRRS